MPRPNRENLRIHSPENPFGKTYCVKWVHFQIGENSEPETLICPKDTTNTLLPASQDHSKEDPFAVIPTGARIFGHDQNTRKKFLFTTKETWHVRKG